MGKRKRLAQLERRLHQHHADGQALLIQGLEQQVRLLEALLDEYTDKQWRIQ